jgi:hypothetical protein
MDLANRCPLRKILLTDPRSGSGARMVAFIILIFFNFFQVFFSFFVQKFVGVYQTFLGFKIVEKLWGVPWETRKNLT